MSNELDICRICEFYIKKDLLLELFSIQVHLHSGSESDMKHEKFSNDDDVPRIMQIPVKICHSCNNRTGSFFKLIKNSDITLKAEIPKNKDILLDEKDVSMFEMISFDNLLDSNHGEDNDDDHDYKPSKSRRKPVKRKKRNQSKTEITVKPEIEPVRQTRSSTRSTRSTKKICKNEPKNDDISIKLNENYDEDNNSTHFNDAFSSDDSQLSDIETNPTSLSSNTFCNYCNETVDNYKQHKKKFHNGIRRPYSCIACRNSYCTAYELYNHQFTSHRPYVGGQCDICKKHYDNLVHHNWKCHEGELCSQCGKTFQSKRQLSNHVETHHTGLNYFCSICNKGFKKPAHLRNHLEYHDENNKIKCSTCGKEFFGKRRLKVHEKTHIVERKSVKSDAVESMTTENHSFKCPFCTLSFICLESLQKHSTFHRIEEKNTEIYKHVCQYCSQRFKRSDHKEIHENGVHKKIFPYKCDTCGLKFVKQNFLNYHIKKAHSGVRFQCNMCPKSFTLASTLRRHEKNKHFDLAKCNCCVCGEEFKNIRFLLAHLKTHTFEEEKEAAERVYQELLSKQKTTNQQGNSVDFLQN